MDELLINMDKSCEFCKNNDLDCEFQSDMCIYCMEVENQFEPTDTLLEIDRLVKLGRRYDNADEKLAASKMEKYRGNKIE